MSEEKQVSIQEIAVSNMISIEALLRILVKRGFITKEEIKDEVKQVKLEQEAKKNYLGRVKIIDRNTPLFSIVHKSQFSVCFCKMIFSISALSFPEDGNSLTNSLCWQ